MRGYLLDTNIIEYLFNEKRLEHPRVFARYSELSKLETESPFRISAITLGEMEYGIRSNALNGLTPIQIEFKKLVREKFANVLPIRSHTAIPYGELRSGLFAKYAKKKGKKARRPEQLLDPATSLELGIHENDLWIAAQAIEYNLVLVTHDDDMTRIREVSQGLLTIEDWT